MAPSINAQSHSANYFAEDRWPTYDFKNKTITFFPVRPASNKPVEESLQGVAI